MKRLVALAAMTIAGGVLMTAATPNQAQAAGCYYGVMQHGVGMIGIVGNGHAAEKLGLQPRPPRVQSSPRTGSQQRSCRAAAPAISAASATGHDRVQR